MKTMRIAFSIQIKLIQINILIFAMINANKNKIEIVIISTIIMKVQKKTVRKINYIKKKPVLNRSKTGNTKESLVTKTIQITKISSSN